MAAQNFLRLKTGLNSFTPSLTRRTNPTLALLSRAQHGEAL